VVGGGEFEFNALDDAGFVCSFKLPTTRRETTLHFFEKCPTKFGWYF
jgi:hypothetical protein